MSHDYTIITMDSLGRVFVNGEQRQRRNVRIKDLYNPTGSGDWDTMNFADFAAVFLNAVDPQSFDVEYFLTRFFQLKEWEVVSLYADVWADEELRPTIERAFAESEPWNRRFFMLQAYNRLIKVFDRFRWYNFQDMEEFRQWVEQKRKRQRRSYTAEVDEEGVVVGLDEQFSIRGKRIVITGSLPQKRALYKKAVEDAGGSFSKGLGRETTDYLVVGEKPGSKLQMAQDYGIPIISLKALLDAVAEEGVDVSLLRA